MNIVLTKPGIRNFNEKVLEESSQVERVLSDTFQGIEVFKSFSNEEEGIGIAFKGLQNYQYIEIERNRLVSRFRNSYGFFIHFWPF